MGQPSGEILNHASEYTVRENIVLEVTISQMMEPHVRALLKSRTSLADVHKEWNKAETNHIGDVRDVIEARTDAVIRAEKEKGQREGR